MEPPFDRPELPAFDQPVADRAEPAEIDSRADDPGLLGENVRLNTSAHTSTPPPIPHHQLTGFHRLVLGCLGILLLSGFALAASLRPDARGFGTHQRLGLPPCSMRVLFGIPCPNCGMTTSFAHFVRGQLPSSLRANAAGALLAMACLVLMPWALGSAFVGRSLIVRDPMLTFVRGLLGLAVIILMHWVWRLWIDGYL